jgi:hypothetical protein
LVLEGFSGDRITVNSTKTVWTAGETVLIRTDTQAVDDREGWVRLDVGPTVTEPKLQRPLRLVTLEDDFPEDGPGGRGA